MAQYHGKPCAICDTTVDTWKGRLMRKNGDKRHDTKVKPELLLDVGILPENTLFILEYRNSMVKKWRELGYRCLQVQDGDF